VRKAIVLAALGASSLVCVGGILVARADHGGEKPAIAARTAAATRSRSNRVHGASPSLVRPSRTVPLRAPTAPARARAVATSYAIDAFSAIEGEPTNAWVRLVGSLCAPAWHSHIEDAKSAVRLATTTIRPVVIATFASWAPADAVGVTVLLTSAGRIESLYLELRLRNGHYLVEAAQ